MSQDVTGRICSCTIDGASYQNGESAMVHMKMQHSIMNSGSFYVRERTIGALTKEKPGRDDEHLLKR